MKLRFMFLIIILEFSIISLRAQSFRPDDPIPPDPQIRTGKLDNGLTYYIKKNSKPEQRVEFRLAINAGSVCENDGQQGLAHFMEHMCFNGTKNFPSNRIIDMLEEMGVKFGEELNAYTSFDETVYMLKVPADKMEWVDRGFQVLEDWAHQVTLEEAEIDKERGVIIEEWRLGLGAEDRMQAKYIPVLLKGSRYAERLPIGNIDIIKSFHYDTLRSFYDTWYRPDLMAVAVVGDIDPDVAEAKVKEYFGRVPRAEKQEPRDEFPIPDNDEPLISVVTDREATGYSAIVFIKHPRLEEGTYNAYRLQLMQLLYTGMLNKRLGEIAQKPGSPFLYAGSGYGAFIGRSSDSYQLMVSAKENQIEESMKVLLQENERVRRYGFLASELEREKKEILTAYEKLAMEADKTESASFADEYVRNYLEKEPIPGIRKEFEMVSEFLPEIKLEEINDLGKEWIKDENIVVLVTAREKEGVKVPTEGDVLDIIKSAAGLELEPYAEELSEEPLLKEEPIPGKVTGITGNTIFGYTEVSFSNGVRMILKPTDFKNDEIVISAFSPGGLSLYPDEDIMSAMLASSVVVQSGLGEYDYTGLQKKLSGNTARLTPFINNLHEGVSGNCSPRDLETLLQLNYLYFTATRSDEDAFNAFISRLRNTIKPMRTNPLVMFQDTLTKIVSSNSRRVIAVPTDKQIDMADHKRILEIFRDRYADAGDFTYFLVGNFSIEEVIPLLEKYIGGLPSSFRKENWRDVEPDFPAGRVEVELPANSEPQSRVAMIWNGDFKWKEKYRYGFPMLMDILSIRLRETMREDQGGVYGVSFSGSPTRFPTPEFSITSMWGCNPDNIDTLSRSVIDEMEKIRRDGPSITDLNKVKETLARERETRVRENSFWISALQNHYLYGNRLLTLEEYKDYINSFTGKDIRMIARKYLDTSNYVKVALTPAPSSVEKQP
ncbi:MAG TPA: insulinase family protein [Bacteroidales bacterium]|nr:insulinase family protein [Bacteroidales bacterium]